MLVGDRDPCRRLYVDPAKEIRPDWPVVIIAQAGHITCRIKEQFNRELEKWVGKNGQ